MDQERKLGRGAPIVGSDVVVFQQENTCSRLESKPVGSSMPDYE